MSSPSERGLSAGMRAAHRRAGKLVIGWLAVSVFLGMWADSVPDGTPDWTWRQAVLVSVISGMLLAVVLLSPPPTVVTVPAAIASTLFWVAAVAAIFSLRVYERGPEWSWAMLPFAPLITAQAGPAVELSLRRWRAFLSARLPKALPRWLVKDGPWILKD